MEQYIEKIDGKWYRTYVKTIEHENDYQYQTDLYNHIANGWYVYECKLTYTVMKKRVLIDKTI